MATRKKITASEETLTVDAVVKETTQTVYRIKKSTLFVEQGADFVYENQQGREVYIRPQDMPELILLFQAYLQDNPQ
jgi:hypothetical protein